MLFVSFMAGLASQLGGALQKAHAHHHKSKGKVFMSIYFGGSRHISQIPPQVIPQVLQAGQVVHVGCCVGADALCIQSSLCSSLFSQVRVFSIFSQSGAGACGFSAVQVVQSFAAAGGAVQWLAGGSLSVPLVARLIRRSVAALAGCSSAVFFSPRSGSLAVASHAVQSGILVFALGAMPAAIPSQAGHWCKVSASVIVPSLSSCPAGAFCWQWHSAQASLF